jgi:hypothetical protein
MKGVAWLLVLAALAALGYALWNWRRRWHEHQRATEERLAAFIAQAKPSADAGSALQKLLFDAAAKAGQAGETALSIELYGRLLARFPESAFGEQARAAIEAEKAKLAKS